MNEEDVMETSIMHLCIPDYETKEKEGVIAPSEWSLNALSVLLNEQSDTEYSYHFPVYDINDQPSNAVIIRNLPPYIDFRAQDGNELKSMIESVSRIVSIHQARGYGVVRVTFGGSQDALRVVERLDGWTFERRNLHLHLTQGKKE